MHSKSILIFFGILYCFVRGNDGDAPAALYEVSDDLGLGRRFEGIGGLSGGGATSKLLVNYIEPQRSQILDYLFKPNFGASLHILKVEIGGDDQSTDGTESSHMHEEWDENYNRGYEWWLMKEAKKRNPDIKLWGLSWTWPGWIGGGKNSPYKNLTKTAMYTVKWIQGAKTVHNLDIDYIGIWNEQYCNFDYILELRKALNRNKLQQVQIVACDGWVGDLYSWMKNQTIASSVYAFGVHYPGTISSKEAIATNLSIWSSEDYSTFDDDVGAGCWGRILNQNYVNGYMTSTTAWNLIASYYKGLPYEYDGLMNAIEPWSGYYEVKNPIWISAHTTQFSKIGYRYLQHGRGVGKLQYGGSYVTLTSKDRKNVTIVIETFTHDHSVCIRPSLPPYTVQQQKAIFKLGGTFAQLGQMHLWKSRYDFSDPSKSIIFHYEGKVEVTDSRVALDLDIDSVYTLTTVKTGQKGDFGQVPSSKPFPLPYFDDFQKYQLNEEPFLLSPQIGVWEINRDSDGNQFTRQVIQTQPVTWCGQTNPYPAAVIGDPTWENVAISVKIRIPSVNGTSQVFLALRVTKAGCDMGSANGYFFWLTANSRGYAVSSDIAGLNITDAGLLSSDSPIVFDKWYNVSIGIKDNVFTTKVDNMIISQLELTIDDSMANSQGFGALGTGGWGLADYDDLRINTNN